MFAMEGISTRLRIGTRTYPLDSVRVCHFALEFLLERGEVLCLGLLARRPLVFTREEPLYRLSEFPTDLQHDLCPGLDFAMLQRRKVTLTNANTTREFLLPYVKAPKLPNPPANRLPVNGSFSRFWP